MVEERGQWRTFGHDTALSQPHLKADDEEGEELRMTTGI
jgi:hypothetical protein